MKALITGASSGIGAATARILASAGWELVLVARREERLGDLVRHIGGRAQALALDLRAADFTQRLEDAVDLSKVDTLINNAGLAKGVDRLQDGKLADWEAMIDTNVTALLRLTRALLPPMLVAGRGHIVNIGSVAGRWAYPGGAVYCATKFAVRALSEGLRMDLLGTPIRVTNIEPGMVETEFSEVRLGSSERAKSVYRGMKPLSAEDIAETILWSLSRPQHVNVQEIVIMPTDQAAIGMVHRRD